MLQELIEHIFFQFQPFLRSVFDSNNELCKRYNLKQWQQKKTYRHH